MNQDLTKGPIARTLLLFALPMTLGNMLQQLYNVADTLIVGRFLGPDALAAVGSAYTLMTFLTSIFLGLCMGSGAIFSIRYGAKDEDALKSSIFVSFALIAAITCGISALVVLVIGPIMAVRQVPGTVDGMLRSYLWVIFTGLVAAFLYNYFAFLLRALGNSVAPLLFLAVSAILNIILDLVFVVVFHWGVEGAAGATVFSQYVSGIGIALYTLGRFPRLRPERRHRKFSRRILGEIAQFSVLTCVQQSVMNFGILMVQGLVNSFGAPIMEACATAVPRQALAYTPLHALGTAFTSFPAPDS